MFLAAKSRCTILFFSKYFIPAEIWTKKLHSVEIWNLCLSCRSLFSKVPSGASSVTLSYEENDKNRRKYLKNRSYLLYYR